MEWKWHRRIADWQNIYSFIALEIKVFIYFLFVFCLFRVSFIVLLHDYLGSDTTASDIGVAFFYGMKLSLKSVGILTAISTGYGVLFYLFLPRYLFLAQKILGVVYLLVFTLLFCGRIPYYEQFLSGYNQLIFNTLNDDVYALFVSLVDQFNLPIRLVLVLIIVIFLYQIFVRWLSVSVWSLPVLPTKLGTWLVRICFFILIYYGVIFINYGGAMSYVGNVDWENAGVTKDRLLNEAILDDMQAIYRAYEMNGRLESSTGLAYSAAQVKAYAKILTGKDFESKYLDEYLQKSAQGNGHRPKHIFLIVAESYANWPLLAKYSNLHLADGMKAIIRRENSAYTANFLPNGMSTISGAMGIITGFADANLYLTTMPEAYGEPYSTALAPQLRKLGYRANFWYAGPPSWEKIKDFSQAQGFQQFYGSGDYSDCQGNVWGCDDEFLYKAILAGVNEEEASFNLVLNVSNHSPFTVDLDKAGFDREKIKAALPENVKDDQALIKQLGHFWYADKMLAEFIDKAAKKYPDSLFLVVGDHADRVNIDKTPSLYERYGIPFIVTGQGIHQGSLRKGSAGSHIDVIPTLLELVAPEEFTYYAVGKSLTQENLFGVNYGFWITDGYIGETDGGFAPEEIRPGGKLPAQKELNDYINAVRSISWWRSKYGNECSE